MDDLPKTLIKIQDDITEIKVSQARTEQDLKHHITLTVASTCGLTAGGGYYHYYVGPGS